MKRIKKILLTVKLFIEDYWNLEIGGKKLPKPTARETVLIGVLRKSINSTGKNTGGKTWRGFSMRLRNYVRFFDPRRFLRWHVIRQTMFMAEAWKECVDELTHDARWSSLWRSLIAEDRFGDPLPDPRLLESSGNRIVHAYHLQQLQKTTEIRFGALDTVVEFGGGYGNMCRLIRRLGFKGTYILFDLPEFLALQHFYLNGVGNGAVYATDITHNTQGQNILLQSPDELKTLLSRVAHKNSLFIGTWSVSESPVSVREQILPLVADSTYFLFGYQPHFDTVDNVAYFRDFAKKHSHVEWTEVFKSMWNGYYLFGRKK